MFCFLLQMNLICPIRPALTDYRMDLALRTIALWVRRRLQVPVGVPTVPKWIFSLVRVVLVRAAFRHLRDIRQLQILIPVCFSKLCIFQFKNGGCLVKEGLHSKTTNQIQSNWIMELNNEPIFLTYMQKK